MDLNSENSTHFPKITDFSITEAKKHHENTQNLQYTEKTVQIMDGICQQKRKDRRKKEEAAVFKC